MTIDMTGDMSPPVRAEYWQSRRVFFVTPQCLEKDIQSGKILISLLQNVGDVPLKQAHLSHSWVLVVQNLGFLLKTECRILRKQAGVKILRAADD